MTSIKLCLGSLAFAALLAVILLTPANVLAQTSRTPRYQTVARPSASLARRTALVCTTRALDQGSGSVRICAAPLPR